MELVLGTVQFGLPYGIAGSGRVVPESEVRAILESAWRFGIRKLDTAAVYGDIEERLLELTQGREFEVYSKIPAIPAELPAEEAARWGVHHAEQSLRRLKSLMCGLMLHRASDLLGERGSIIWRELSAWCAEHDIALGASFYSPEECFESHLARPMRIAQVPGNAFDQRIAYPGAERDPSLELHLRSVFLQGLLLMNAAQVSDKLPSAGGAMLKWERWCAEMELSPLQASLSIARGFRNISAVVVGVDTRLQLSEIADAWARSAPIVAQELACADVRITDPRLWPRQH